jgi:hypothetical protein
MLTLPMQLWKEYRFQICIITAVVCVIYITSLSDATTNPWTLWRQEWRQDSRGHQRRIASYQSQKVCIEEQRKKLREQLELKEKANTIIVKKPQDVLNSRTVLIQEGATIFEFKKSALFPKTPSLPADMQTENVAVMSFFCAPTSSLYGLWPYHTPSYSVASEALKRVGKRALAIQAKQLFEDH